MRGCFWCGLLCLVFAALTGMASQANAEASIESVLKACKEKTIVYGRDEKGGLVKVGETIDGYCRGFLEGVLASLDHAQTICVKDKNTSPDFLLSTVLTYRAEAKSQDNDAVTVIESAFKRAFNCTK
jgi:hypothetical protein